MAKQEEYRSIDKSDKTDKTDNCLHDELAGNFLDIYNTSEIIE